MGLPVVMTRISGIVPYIEKFKAGEVIDSMEELPRAILQIANNSSTYSKGAMLFSECFEYNKYYKSRIVCD